MWRKIKDDPRITFNLLLAIVWAVMTPVAYFMGWLNSVVFVSLLSIAALLITNLAAWLAEMKLMKEDDK